MPSCLLSQLLVFSWDHSVELGVFDQSMHIQEMLVPFDGYNSWIVWIQFSFFESIENIFCSFLQSVMWFEAWYLPDLVEANSVAPLDPQWHIETWVCLLWESTALALYVSRAEDGFLVHHEELHLSKSCLPRQHEASANTKNLG